MHAHVYIYVSILHASCATTMGSAVFREQEIELSAVSKEAQCHLDWCQGILRSSPESLRGVQK